MKRIRIVGFFIGIFCMILCGFLIFGDSVISSAEEYPLLNTYTVNLKKPKSKDLIDQNGIDTEGHETIPVFTDDGILKALEYSEWIFSYDNETWERCADIYFFPCFYYKRYVRKSEVCAPQKLADVGIYTLNGTTYSNATEFIAALRKWRSDNVETVLQPEWIVLKEHVTDVAPSVGEKIDLLGGGFKHCSFQDFADDGSLCMDLSFYWEVSDDGKNWIKANSEYFLAGKYYRCSYPEGSGGPPTKKLAETGIFKFNDKIYTSATDYIAALRIFNEKACNGEMIYHLHIWSDWKTVKNPTCVVTGEEIRTCFCCAKETRSINIKEHTFGAWKQTKAPTCTASGEETRTCSCGKAEVKTIAATGHVLGNWIQTKAPTTTSEGELTRSCSNCDYAEMSIVSKLPESSDKVEVSTDSTAKVDTDVVVDSTSTENVETDIPSDSDSVTDILSDSESVSSSDFDVTTEFDVVDSVETDDANPSDITEMKTDSLNSESSETEPAGEGLSVGAMIGIVVGAVVVCAGVVVLIVFRKKIFHKN